jgi:hypothetical protein
MIQALTDFTELPTVLKLRRSNLSVVRFIVRNSSFVQSKAEISDRESMQELPKKSVFFMRLSIFIGIGALLLSLASLYTMALLASAGAAGSLVFGVLLSFGPKKIRVSPPTSSEVNPPAEPAKPNKKGLKEVI